jgi:hypothetical protein
LLEDYETIHFPATVRCPGGFSFEESPTVPQERTIPQIPSMQGMGTSVCHIYEMVCREQDGAILLLPAWPLDKALRIALYSPLAGRLEIDYTPGGPVKVNSERLVSFGVVLGSPLKIEKMVLI